MRKLPPFIVKKRKGKDAGFFINTATGRRIKDTTVKKYQRQYKRFKKEGLKDAEITMPMLAGNMYVIHEKDAEGRITIKDKEDMTRKTRKLMKKGQRVMRGKTVSGRQRYYDPVLKKFYTKKQIKRVKRDYITKAGIKVFLYRVNMSKHRIYHVLVQKPNIHFESKLGIVDNVGNGLGEILAEAHRVSRIHRLAKVQVAYAVGKFHYTTADGIDEDAFYTNMPSSKVYKARGDDAFEGYSDIGTRRGITDFRSDIEKVVFHYLRKRTASSRGRTLTLDEIVILPWTFYNRKAKAHAPVAESRQGVRDYMRYD